jgi:hypothetical protein
MLCERCKEKGATVHIKGTRRTDGVTPEAVTDFEHHYCETCAKELEQTDPRWNPMLNASPGTRKWKFRVTGVSGERVTVREIHPDNSVAENEMSFLIARLLVARPPEDYLFLGAEFELTCTESHLWRLTEDRDW